MRTSRVVLGLLVLAGMGAGAALTSMDSTAAPGDARGGGRELSRGRVASDPAARPTGDEAPPAAGPAGAVWAMLDAFGRRSVEGYVGLMADDFHFDSDDPGFRDACAAGFSRADERAFAGHLFVGGARGLDGRELPVAARVDVAAGPLLAERTDGARAQARVTLDHLHARILLADSTVLDLGETRSTFDLVLTEAGWRVRRWSEAHATAPEREALARRLDEAARGAARAASGEPDLPLPARLTIRARSDRGRGALVFALELPRAGGALELYDVQGRRVAQQPLADRGAGRHAVALDGARVSPGVYWVRVRQGGDAAVAKVVWMR